MSYAISTDQKKRYKRILSLGLPIVGGMISQNVINLVDTAMVGSLGDVALAAVGTGSFIAFMAVSVVMGLSTGVQAIVARRVGEGNTKDVATALNGALIVAVISGLILSTLYWLSAETIFTWVNKDPDVLAMGVPYIELRVWTITAVGINMSFRGFWNGTDRSVLYLKTLVFIHSSNILLNYIFIFGNWGFPAMGTQGAAVGTTASMFMGCGYYFYLGFKHAKHQGFCMKRCTRPVLRSLLRLTIPNSLQQLFFATGYTVLFWIIGQVGTAETAAANVLVNLMLVAILPSIAFGLASTTLVGQAMGRSDIEDAYRWGWDVVKVASVILLLLGIAMFVFPRLWLGIFLHNPETLELAR
ncbi:MAG: MATE family efflux transporter, partial [Deltaproteobacteria bacterium]|nr:MATE family efflux transporter [Deltaproteobacteria bacterium]